MFSSDFAYGDYLIHHNLIHPFEFVLAIFYLLLIYIFAFIHRNRFYKNSPLKKYFIPGLTVKLIGACGVCLVYNYYYAGGDTNAYYIGGKIISSIFVNNPIDGIMVLFSSGKDMPADLLVHFSNYVFTYDSSAFMIAKICGLIQLIAFQSILVTSILFGFFSFFAIWQLYQLFCRLYPSLIKSFAFAFLFMPSVFFWGSGILKDTICLACLSILFCGAYAFFLKGENKLINGFIILICGYILTIVKPYIVMSFSVCLIILVFINYRNRLKSQNLRLFITPIFIAFALVFAAFLVKIIGENSTTNRYSMDKIIETSTITRQYLNTVASGSAYSIGEVDNSAWGMIKVFPACVNVTLFRPYLWEAHNIIALIAALESFVVLSLTLSVMYKSGFFTFFKTITSNNLIFFCVMFSIIFAFAVGLTSSNFGTLVRYKIPCVPFYMSGVFITNMIAAQIKSKKMTLASEDNFS